MLDSEWSKSLLGVGRTCAVSAGGLPVRVSLNIDYGDSIFPGLPMICTDGYIRFVEPDQSLFRQWNMVKKTFEHDISVNAWGAATILDQGDYLFLGEQVISKKSMELKIDLLREIPGEKFIRSGRMDYWGEMSAVGDACYLEKTFYRIMDCNDASKGVLAIDTERWDVKRVDYPFLTIEPGINGWVFGNTDHGVGAYCFREGIKWTFEIAKKEDYTMEHRVNFALFDEKILVVSRQGDLICLNQSDGSVIWKVKAASLFREDKRSSISLSVPHVNERVAVISNGAGYKLLFSINLVDGSLFWSEERDDINSCIAGDLFFTTSKRGGGKPIAKDCYSGETVWEADEMFHDAYRIIASNKYVIYLSTYFYGFIFEWDEPYISPHRPV